jgi:hypothetical protein
MKKSTLGILALIAFGLVPFFYGIYVVNYEDVPLAGTDLVEAYMEEPTEAPEQMAMASPDDTSEYAMPDPPPNFDEVSKALAELQKPLDEPVTMSAPPPVTGASAERSKELAAVVKEWVGVFGTITTPLLSWFTFIVSRREKQRIADGVPTLVTPRWWDNVQLLFKAIGHRANWLRWKFRHNEHWSIYGATHTALWPKPNGRPLQHITRNGTPSEIVLHAQPGVEDWIPNTRPMYSVDKAFSATKGTYHEVNDLDAWTVNQFYSEIPELLRELDADEIAIHLIFNRSGHMQSYTLQSTKALMPETFEEWEDLLVQFHRYYATLSVNCVLLDVIAIHKPVK